MASKLLTTWAEHEIAVQEILLLASHTLRIFDENLSTLALERPDRLAALRRLLASSPQHTLQIVVRDATLLQRNYPQLIKLLGTHSHNLKISESPSHLAALNDSLFLADGRHALVRFHKDHARAKVIINDTGECVPYENRFAEILEEGGTPQYSTTLGL
jgi:hypothetical protein